MLLLATWKEPRQIQKKIDLQSSILRETSGTRLGIYEFLWESAGIGCMRPHHRPPRSRPPATWLLPVFEHQACPVHPSRNTSNLGHMFTQVSAPSSGVGGAPWGGDYVSFTFKSRAEHKVGGQFKKPMTSRLPTLKGHDESQDFSTASGQLSRWCSGLLWSPEA